MLKEKKIEIAFEIARALVFGKNRQDHTAWCAECEAQVPMISLQTAAMLEKTTYADICRRVEKGDLHYRLTNKNALLVCFVSLLGTEQKSVNTEMFR